MNYKIKNISKENFKNYGDLITTSNKNYESINKDTTDSFFDLANIQIIGDDKRSRLNIFQAKKRKFPLKKQATNPLVPNIKLHDEVAVGDAARNVGARKGRSGFLVF